MTYEPQRITAPDGTPLVVIRESDYELLIAAATLDEDARDALLARRALAESDARYPAEVVDAMLAGRTPVAAWRRYRGLSQGELAKRVGISQSGIGMLEVRRNGRTPVGRWQTRVAIAKALDIPVSALDPLED